MGVVGVVRDKKERRIRAEGRKRIVERGGRGSILGEILGIC